MRPSSEGPLLPIESNVPLCTPESPSPHPRGCTGNVANATGVTEFMIRFSDGCVAVPEWVDGSAMKSSFASLHEWM
jgi:hypothetical protein